MPGSLQEVAVETEGGRWSPVSGKTGKWCSAIRWWRYYFHSSQLNHHPSSSPENCRAKPCLLVKKSVVNCRLTVLKVLWASGGSIEPLSSRSRTPPSWGPSQIRSTSWTSSVWKTRKWRLLKRHRRDTSDAVTAGRQHSLWIYTLTLTHVPSQFSLYREQPQANKSCLFPHREINSWLWTPPPISFLMLFKQISDPF